MQIQKYISKYHLRNLVKCYAFVRTLSKKLSFTLFTCKNQHQIHAKIKEIVPMLINHHVT